MKLRRYAKGFYFVTSQKKPWRDIKRARVFINFNFDDLFLILNQSYNKDQEACADHATDDVADEAMEADAENAKQRACNCASDNAKDNVDDNAVLTLHDDACQPSADGTYNKTNDKINHFSLSFLFSESVSEFIF